MTTVEAVTEVLKEWVPGTALYGYEIHKKVVVKLKAAGEKKETPGRYSPQADARESQYLRGEGNQASRQPVFQGAEKVFGSRTFITRSWNN